MPTLRDLGEFEAIRWLNGARSRAGAGDAPSGVIVGSGDDAAVLRLDADTDLVATTDAFVECRHYAPEHFAPREVGARLAIANLSDLAAMAARPRWGLLSLGVRSTHAMEELVELQAGLLETLAGDGATLAGGNLVAVYGEEWLSLTLFGESPRGRAWTRAGARPGDLIAVTGFPGRAGAGARLAARANAMAQASECQALLDAWIRPLSRVGFALGLAPLDGVKAATDLSDGFAGDLVHLCEASGVGADLEEGAWPTDPLIERAAQALGVGAEALAFGPSDDYELLLAVTPARRAVCEEVARKHGVRLAFVGKVTDRRGAVAWVDHRGHRRPLEGSGYDHFG